jgi:NADPH:quinone reductase-like Zn-dependent oxidoreductase
LSTWILPSLRYSSINYKDALAASGAGKIIRRFPCVGGIDGCGTVVSSADTRFKTRRRVLVTGAGLSGARWRILRYLRLDVWVLGAQRPQLA